jgi:hypothetical protein
LPISSGKGISWRAASACRLPSSPLIYSERLRTRLAKRTKEEEKKKKKKKKNKRKKKKRKKRKTKKK